MYILITTPELFTYINPINSHASQKTFIALIVSFQNINGEMARSFGFLIATEVVKKGDRI